MLSPALESQMKSAQRNELILWFSFVFSVVMFVVAAAFAIEKKAGAAVLSDELRLTLTALAVVLAVVSLVLWRYRTSDKFLSAALSKEYSPEGLATDQRTKLVNQARLLKLQELSPQELKLAGLLSQASNLLVLNLMLSEPVAIFGLAQAFLGQSLELMMPFALAALALHLIMFPNPAGLIKRAAARRV